MRVGEALRLEPGDIDRDHGVIVIRQSKFGKSRLVPILPDTLAALDRLHRATVTGCYASNAPRPDCSARVRGTEVIYPVVQQVFRHLCDTAQHRRRRAAPAENS